jgi:GRAM domain-containing protein 4
MSCPLYFRCLQLIARGKRYCHARTLPISLTALLRLPPIFSNVPTDADYAMELISQRVAAGLDVRPSDPRRQGKKKQAPNRNTKHLADIVEDVTKNGKGKQKEKTEIDWKKWGERVAIGKAQADEGRRLILGEQGAKNSKSHP